MYNNSKWSYLSIIIHWICATDIKPSNSSTEDYAACLVEYSWYYPLWVCLSSGQIIMGGFHDYSSTSTAGWWCTASKTVEKCSVSSKQCEASHNISDQWNIHILKWEILSYPPYFSNFSSSDYLLFLSLDNHMHNWQFWNQKELNNSFASKIKFYKNGISKNLFFIWKNYWLWWCLFSRLKLFCSFLWMI